ncbi:hypothetical protein DRQ29_06090, partial [bacterium]
MRKIYHILLPTILLSSAFAVIVPYKGKIYLSEPVIHWDDGYYFSASFSKPMLGVGDRLYSASLTFFIPQNLFCCGSFGLSISHLGNTYSNFQRLAVFAKSPKLLAGNVALSGWISPGVERAGYSSGNFYRFDSSD